MSTAPKILVADDSLTIRKLVETVLNQDGYQVITAENGTDCLARAVEHKPNLILLDYILPDMQGTEICRHLINSPETWEIPVLMMSSNGNAIRQLYQDLNNVVDYLTKPFAPNILRAVVGHLLQEHKAPVPAAEPVAVSVAAAAAESGVPRELMDKVARLLDLMENRPAPAAAAPAEASAVPAEPAPPAAPPAKAKSKSTRTRKKITSAPPPPAVARKFRLSLQKHLRGRLGHIPDWESDRASEEPEDYFLPRLLPTELLDELSGNLLRASGVPAEGPGALRCPVGLVGLDSVLRHLAATRATGELQIEIGPETVLACVERGQVVLLTSNDPRHYCAGSGYDFQAVPHAFIGEAVRAQEEQSIPFFLSLRSNGPLAPGASLEELLRAQGERCLVRAFRAADAVLSFFPLAKLPSIVRASRLDVPLNQLLLVCYRTVDDWFSLEKVFTSMDVVLAPTPEARAQVGELDLTAEEAASFDAVRPGRSVLEVAEATGMKPFAVCRALFCFVKLGLVGPGLRSEAESPGRGTARSSNADPATPAPAETALEPAPPPAIPVAENAPLEPPSGPAHAVADAPAVLADPLPASVAEPSLAAVACAAAAAEAPTESAAMPSVSQLDLSVAPPVVAAGAAEEAAPPVPESTAATVLAAFAGEGSDPGSAGVAIPTAEPAAQTV